MSVSNTLGYASFPVPIGTIFFYAGLDVPDTYLDCQGETFNPGEYPLLAGLLGINRTPALEGKIIGGGPLADANQLKPANGGTIAPSTSFTLTAANIPTLANIALTAGATSARSTFQGWLEIAPVPFTDQPNLQQDAATYNTTVKKITDWTTTTPPLTTEAIPTPVTASITPGAITPGTLCLRYIIKAKY